MKTAKTTRLIREGDYLAEVEVELTYEEDGWSPYLSLEDALKLDEVKLALQRGDVLTAGKLGKVFSVVPLKRKRSPSLAPVSIQD